MLAYYNGNLACIIVNSVNICYSFEKRIALEAKRLEPKSGPTYVGSDLGSSIFAMHRKY